MPHCATLPPLEGLGEVNYAFLIIHSALRYALADTIRRTWASERKKALPVAA